MVQSMVLAPLFDLVFRGRHRLCSWLWHYRSTPFSTTYATCCSWIKLFHWLRWWRRIIAKVKLMVIWKEIHEWESFKKCNYFNHENFRRCESLAESNILYENHFIATSIVQLSSRPPANINCVLEKSGNANGAYQLIERVGHLFNWLREISLLNQVHTTRANISNTEERENKGKIRELAVANVINRLSHIISDCFFFAPFYQDHVVELEGAIN